MAKFSKKMMGKEVGGASVYAKPHTMSGAPLRLSKAVDANALSSKQVNVDSPAMHVGVGNADKDVKTTGIETRGNGAATKGRMARGPMA